MMQTLHWDAIYEIALALKERHPDVNLEEVSLTDVYNWTMALPGFQGEPEFANDEILMSIYQEWYEECNPL